MLLLGVGAAEVARRPAIIGPALLLMFLLFGISRYHRHSQPRYKNEDVRALAVFLRGQDTALPLFVSTGYMVRPIRHYLGDTPAIHPIPNVLPDSTNLEQVLPSFQSQAPSDAPFWLAYTREFHGDPRGHLLARLRQRYSVTLQTSFPGVRLYRLGPAAPTTP
jgi:hypothetical protein